jgi:hypothetical protein
MICSASASLVGRCPADSPAATVAPGMVNALFLMPRRTSTRGSASSPWQLTQTTERASAIRCAHSAARAVLPDPAGALRSTSGVVQPSSTTESRLRETWSRVVRGTSDLVRAISSEATVSARAERSSSPVAGPPASMSTTSRGEAALSPPSVPSPCSRGGALTSPVSGGRLHRS